MSEQECTGCEVCGFEGDGSCAPHSETEQGPAPEMPQGENKLEDFCDACGNLLPKWEGFRKSTDDWGRFWDKWQRRICPKCGKIEEREKPSRPDKLRDEIKRLTALVASQQAVIEKLKHRLAKCNEPLVLAEMVSTRQLGIIKATCRENNWDANHLSVEAMGLPVADLSQHAASRFITYLQEEKEALKGTKQ